MANLHQGWCYNLILPSVNDIFIVGLGSGSALSVMAVGLLLLESGGFVFVVDNLTWALRANIHDSYADQVSSSLRVAIHSSCQ